MEKYPSKTSNQNCSAITSISKTLFSGIGKPEPLKFNLKGKWSRRISHEHRLVYEVTVEENFIMSNNG
jgi:toxin YoeB